VRAVRRPAAARSVPRPFRQRARVRARVPVLAGAGLMLVVGLGAANYGGVNATSHASSGVRGAVTHR